MGWEGINDVYALLWCHIEWNGFPNWQNEANDGIVPVQKSVTNTVENTVEKSLPLQQHPHDSEKGERPILTAFAAAGKWVMPTMAEFVPSFSSEDHSKVFSLFWEG